MAFSQSSDEIGSCYIMLRTINRIEITINNIPSTRLNHVSETASKVLFPSHIPRKIMGKISRPKNATLGVSRPLTMNVAVWEMAAGR